MVRKKDFCIVLFYCIIAKKHEQSISFRHFVHDKQSKFQLNTLSQF